MSILNSELERIANVLPEKIAIAGIDDAWCTYGRLVERISNLAQDLDRLSRFYGIFRVGLIATDSISSVELVFAIAKLRLSLVTLNTSLRVNQVEQILRKSVSGWLISDSKKYDTDFEYVDQIGDFFLYRVDLNNYAGREFKSRNSDQFLITASSGSTGNPKPIVFSQELKLARASQSKKLYSVTQDEIVLNASPFSHSLGQRLTFLPLLSGATLILLPKFSSTDWVEAVRRYRVSFTICVSSHLHGLTNVLLSNDFQLDSIRCLVSSSASLNSTVKEGLFSSQHFEFHEQYGASEVATVTNASPLDFRPNLDSVGSPCENISVEIRSSNGEICNPGIPGEIFVRSPLVCEGYLTEKGVLPATTEDGWFPTSDQGILDESGQLFFLGRSIDVIAVGGQNLFPQDIERVILECQDIIECSVVAKKDDYFGEVPIAFLVGRNNSMELQAQVRDLVATKLATYQQPMHYTWLPELPKLPSGKVDKVELRTLSDRLQRRNGNRIITQIFTADD